jgi:hypothetical protein
MNIDRQSFLDSHLDGLGPLPGSISRILALMRELDARTVRLEEQLGNEKSNVLSELRQMSKSGVKDADVLRTQPGYKRLQALSNEMLMLSDEKVCLARQVLDIVEGAARTLEGDALELAEELAMDLPGPRRDPRELFEEAKANIRATLEKQRLANKESARYGPYPKLKPTSHHKKDPKNIFSSDFAEGVEDEGLGGFGLPAAPVVGAAAADEDTGPYCICKQGSHGEMIACDNANCPNPGEWFHLGCMGLIEAPKGKWLCPDCKTR